jgi:hypothetical protein
MVKESLPVMSTFTRPNGLVINFYDHVKAEVLEHLGSDESVKKAWSTALNLKIGLDENRGVLSLDEIFVLENSLYSRFESLGVPQRLIQPLVAAFRYVQDEKERIAEEEAEKDYERRMVEARKNRRKRKS